MDCDRLELRNNLLQLINQLISEKHYDGIELLLQGKRNINTIKYNSAYFVELCKIHLTDECFEKDFNLYFACENFLKNIAKHSLITETLLELLEIIDSTDSDNVFTSALKSLQILLLRDESDRKSLEWGLNEVNSFILKLKYPRFLVTGYDKDQKFLLEQNEEIHKILISYITITLFYEPILAVEIKNMQKQQFRDTSKNKINVLSSFLFKLLGQPLALLDLSSNEKRKTNIHSIQCGKQIATDLCKIFKNPYYLLQYVEERCRWKQKYIKNEIYEVNCKNIFLNDKIFPLLSFGVYYYLLISEELLPSDAPLIYNPIYIFESCLYLIVHLLKEDQPSIHYKAINLGKKMLNNLDDVKIGSLSLDLKIYANFCEQLTKVVIYSEQEEIRKNGIQLFESFILQFDLEAQSIILKKLLEITQHSGLKAYFMTIFKKLVSKQIDNNYDLRHFCTGSEFKYILLTLCCKLEKGAETDLIENSDKIITALNLVRYFSQRDKRNYTGFWSFAKEIEKQFLNPLRDGLNLSKAHYKAEEYRVQNDIQMEGENEIFEKFMINNNNLPNFDKNQKLSILSRSMVTFDLIENFYRNFSKLTTSKTLFNQLYWNTNLYVTLGRNYYYGTNFNIPLSKFSTSLNNPSINDFRTREEAKEEEYQKREAEKERARTKEEDKVKEEKLKTIRLKIFEAALPFVEEYGWTIDSLVHGAEEAGLPGVAHGLFPDGSIDLILYFYSNCNSKLVEYLKEQTKNGEILPKEPTEFLVKATRYRLELLIPYKKHWPQALAKMALPQNVPKSLAQILTMIDDICYFAGDRSVDFGWYARRVGMSAIYKLTELYMLQDTSENYHLTWEFLKNRVDEAQFVELIFGQSGEPSQRTKNKLNATFETARNILGLNYDRRI